MTASCLSVSIMCVPCLSDSVQLPLGLGGRQNLANPDCGQEVIISNICSIVVTHSK